MGGNIRGEIDLMSEEMGWIQIDVHLPTGIRLSWVYAKTILVLKNLADQLYWRWGDAYDKETTAAEEGTEPLFLGEE